VVLVALVAVVVDASRLFLYRRSPATAADGAATAAIQGVHEAAIYRDPDAFADGALPIDPSAATAAVQRYAQENDLTGRFDDFAVRSVAVTGTTTVTVIFTATVDLPFTAAVPLGSIERPLIVVTSSARAPIG
jgi:Flp pilus assembly protein TadG